MDHSEWIRIAIAMALMLFGFVLLPAFFLMRDKRQDEREASANAEHEGLTAHDEAGASR
jgi:hypothetical protein